MTGRERTRQWTIMIMHAGIHFTQLGSSECKRTAHSLRWMTKVTFNLRYNYNIITYISVFMWGLSCEIEVFIPSLLSILYLYMYIHIIYNLYITVSFSAPLHLCPQLTTVHAALCCSCEWRVMTAQGLREVELAVYEVSTGITFSNDNAIITCTTLNSNYTLCIFFDQTIAYVYTYS